MISQKPWKEDGSDMQHIALNVRVCVGSNSRYFYRLRRGKSLLWNLMSQERSYSREKRLLALWCSCFCPSACIGAARTGRILVKFDIGMFYENLLWIYRFG
jgi:hypothetical protein